MLDAKKEMEEKKEEQGNKEINDRTESWSVKVNKEKVNEMKKTI